MSSAPPLPPSDIRPRSNTAGRIALGCGLAIVAFSTITQIFSMMIPQIMSHYQLDVGTVSRLYIPFSVVEGLLALCALIFGVTGLTSPGLPRGAAAAGTALGGHMLLSLIIGMCIPLLNALN